MRWTNKIERLALFILVCYLWVSLEPTQWCFTLSLLSLAKHFSLGWKVWLGRETGTKTLDIMTLSLMTQHKALISDARRVWYSAWTTQHNNAQPLWCVYSSWVSRFICYLPECHYAVCHCTECRGAKETLSLIWPEHQWRKKVSWYWQQGPHL
jgi:hypothetical protein